MEGRKEILYGFRRNMVKDHSDSEKGNPLPLHRPLFPINGDGSFYMHHPTDRIAHTTAFVTPVVEHWLERTFRASYCSACLSLPSSVPLSRTGKERGRGWGGGGRGRVHWWVEQSTSNPIGVSSRRSVCVTEFGMSRGIKPKKRNMCSFKWRKLGQITAKKVKKERKKKKKKELRNVLDFAGRK